MTERRPRRGAHGRTGPAHAIAQMPWRIPLNTDRPTEPLPPEGVAAIHDAAMRVLEEIGIDFLNDEARAYLRAAGCAIDGVTVRMDRAFVMEQVAKAPPRFDITPRNPERRVTMGGGHMCFVNVSSPPNAMDLDRGRRVGNVEDFQNLMRLTQYFNCIHVAGGYPVEPVDIHASVRHLDCLFDKLTLTDKVVHAYSLGSERVEDVIEMARIASGLTPGRVRERPAPLHQHQLVLAAQARLADARRRHALRPPRPAGDRHALHPRRRDGAGDDGRRRRPVDRRGPRRHRPAPGGAPGRPLHDRHLHLERRHEVRRPGLRHAGIRPRHPDDRPDGPLLRPAAARLLGLRVERTRTDRRCGRA